MHPTKVLSLVLFSFAALASPQGILGQVSNEWNSQSPSVRSERISPNLRIQSPIRLTSNPKSWIQDQDKSPSPKPQEDLGDDKDDEKEMDLLDEDLATDEGLDFDAKDDERRAQRPVFGPWPKKGIRAVTLDIRERNANSPEDVSAQLINSSQSNWTQFTPAPKVFAWAAPDIRYQPLYFEDVSLERYGQTAPDYKQGLTSGFHFFKSVVTLPYQVTQDSPRSCDYPLGFCRPGNTTPYTIQRHWFGLK